jgi:hypothetical protein
MEFGWAASASVGAGQWLGELLVAVHGAADEEFQMFLERLC